MSDQREYYGKDKSKRFDKQYIAFEDNEIICKESEVIPYKECKLSFYNESKDNQLLYTMHLPKMIQ